jgi:hypothetical protein
MSSSDLDKADFNAKRAVDAATNNPGYYKMLTWQERLIVANYLNSIEYNYPEDEPPRMDRTAFGVRSRKE